MRVFFGLKIEAKNKSLFLNFGLINDLKEMEGLFFLCISFFVIIEGALEITS